VGQALLHAASLYAEASGRAGGPAALAQGLSPLDGILVPTFGAFDLAVTFLYPFVAIRLVSEEKRNGAGKLLLQSPAGILPRLAVKLSTLLVFSLLAWAAGLAAVLFWTSAGGHVALPELSNLLLGHLLRLLLATGVAFAAASVCDGAASAAIVTLAFTVGTWALDFVAAGRGGWLERAAGFTPTAGLRVFEHGELRLSVAAGFLGATAAGIVFAAVWMKSWESLRRRSVRSFLVLAAVAAAIFAASDLRSSWDFSEDRRNSFSRADEAALARIGQPVVVTVNLAPEDPRLFDLQRGVLAKLRRVVPDLTVRYAAQSRSGLFESGGSYGEIWYQVGSRKAMLRSTIEPVVLEEIYRLAGMSPPDSGGGPSYPGYPLRARLDGAAWFFYVAWPLAAGLAYVWTRGFWRKRWRDVPARAA